MKRARTPRQKLIAEALVWTLGSDYISYRGIERHLEHVTRSGYVRLEDYNWREMSDRAFKRLVADIRRTAIARKQLTVDGYGRRYLLKAICGLPSQPAWFIGKDRLSGGLRMRSEDGSLVVVTSAHIVRSLR